MRILTVGSGKSGSWAIRGAQLGAALGATVSPFAGLDEMRRHDVVIAVKRVKQSTAETIRASGAFFVWDCVDAWPQKVPAAEWTRDRSIRWAREELARLRPNLVIWPNWTMRDDLQMGDVVPHHSWAYCRANQISETIHCVGYEGSTRYIESISRMISRACEEIGAAFIVNPPDLSEVDVCLALRGPEWWSYPQRHWKPATKLANAHASGTPFIGNRERGYQEIAIGDEVWADSEAELVEGIRSLAPAARRRAISERFRAASYTVEHAAADFRRILCA